MVKFIHTLCVFFYNIFKFLLGILQLTVKFVSVRYY